MENNKITGKDLLNSENTNPKDDIIELSENNDKPITGKELLGDEDNAKISELQKTKGRFGTSNFYGQNELDRLGSNIKLNSNASEGTLASAQSTGEILKKTIKGSTVNFIAGLLDNFDYNIPGIYNMATGKQEKYSSWLHDTAKEMQLYSEENYKIYNSNDFGSLDYWANMGKTTAYSLGLITGTMAEQFAYSALTSSTLGATAELQAASLLKSGSKLLAKSAIYGSLKGIQEGYQNGLETYDNTYQEAIDNGKTDEEAKKIAAKAAHEGYLREVGPLMILNALQMGLIGTTTPFSVASSVNTGLGSGIETLGEHLFKNVTSKVGKRAVNLGIGFASEGFEEGFQTFVSKYSTAKALNAANVYTEPDYWDDEMRDSVLIGALMGGIFQSMGSAKERRNVRKIKETYGKDLDKFIEGSKERTSNILKELKKAEKSGNPLAIHILRNFANEVGVKNALHLDHLNNKETAFEDYVANIDDVLTAINNNDTKALESFGLKTKEDIETAKKNLPKFKEDALAIKQKTVENFAKVPHMGIALEKASYQVRLENNDKLLKENAKEREKLINDNLLLKGESNDTIELYKLESEKAALLEIIQEGTKEESSDLSDYIAEANKIKEIDKKISEIKANENSEVNQESLVTALGSNQEVVQNYIDSNGLIGDTQFAKQKVASLSNPDKILKYVTKEIKNKIEAAKTVEDLKKQQKKAAKNIKDKGVLNSLKKLFTKKEKEINISKEVKSEEKEKTEKIISNTKIKKGEDPFIETDNTTNNGLKTDINTDTDNNNRNNSTENIRVNNEDSDKSLSKKEKKKLKKQKAKEKVAKKLQDLSESTNTVNKSPILKAAERYLIPLLDNIPSEYYNDVISILEKSRNFDNAIIEILAFLKDKKGTKNIVKKLTDFSGKNTKNFEKKYPLKKILEAYKKDKATRIENNEKTINEEGFNKDETYSSEDINSFMVKNLKGIYRKIWTLIQPILKTLNVNIIFTNLNKEIGGKYKNNTIIYNLLNTSNEKSVIAQILLHEAIHSVSSTIVNKVKNNDVKGLTKSQVKAAKNLTELYNKVKETLESNGESFYALTNEKEFLAELSNPDFVERIKTIKTVKNIWQKIKDAILNFFGIGKTNSAYGELSNILEELIKNPIENTVNSEDYSDKKDFNSWNKNGKLNKVIEIMNEYFSEVGIVKPTKEDVYELLEDEIMSSIDEEIKPILAQAFLKNKVRILKERLNSAIQDLKDNKSSVEEEALDLDNKLEKLKEKKSNTKVKVKNNNLTAGLLHIKYKAEGEEIQDIDVENIVTSEFYNNITSLIPGELEKGTKIVFIPNPNSELPMDYDSEGRGISFKEKYPDIDVNSKEYRDVVPVFAYKIGSSGTPIGEPVFILHDVNYFNKNNSTAPEVLSVLTSKFREGLKRGKINSVITNKSKGVFNIFSDGKKKSLKEIYHGFEDDVHILYKDSENNFIDTKTGKKIDEVLKNAVITDLSGDNVSNLYEVRKTAKKNTYDILPVTRGSINESEAFNTVLALLEAKYGNEKLREFFPKGVFDNINSFENYLNNFINAKTKILTLKTLKELSAQNKGIVDIIHNIFKITDRANTSSSDFNVPFVATIKGITIMGRFGKNLNNTNKTEAFAAAMDKLSLTYKNGIPIYKVLQEANKLGLYMFYKNGNTTLKAKDFFLESTKRGKSVPVNISSKASEEFPIFNDSLEPIHNKTGSYEDFKRSNLKSSVISYKIEHEGETKMVSYVNPKIEFEAVEKEDNTIDDTDNTNTDNNTNTDTTNEIDDSYERNYFPTQEPNIPIFSEENNNLPEERETKKTEEDSSNFLDFVENIETEEKEIENNDEFENEEYFNFEDDFGTEEEEDFYVIGRNNEDNEFKYQGEFDIRPKADYSKKINSGLLLPKHIVNTELSNKDGSKRLASSNSKTKTIQINPVETVSEFFNYFEGGEEESITSLQKKKVLSKLKEKGYPLDRIKKIILDTKDANNFLLLHEQSHLDNNDSDVYWKNGKDLLTDDKIEIEARASIDALKVIEDNKNNKFEADYSQKIDDKKRKELEKEKKSLEVELEDIVLKATILEKSNNNSTEKILKSFTDDSENFEIKEENNNSFYIDKRTGDKYIRQSEYTDRVLKKQGLKSTEKNTSQSKRYMAFGATFGSYLDSLARDVFGGNSIKTLDSYKKEVYDKQKNGIKLEIDNRQQKFIIDELSTIKEDLSNRGFKFVTDSLKVRGEFTQELKDKYGVYGIMGEVDLIAYKGDEVYIIDFKNMKFNTQYAKANLQQKLKTWSHQQYTYKLLLENMGLKTGKPNILGYFSHYDRVDDSLKLHTLIPISSVINDLEKTNDLNSSHLIGLEERTAVTSSIKIVKNKTSENKIKTSDEEIKILAKKYNEVSKKIASINSTLENDKSKSKITSQQDLPILEDVKKITTNKTNIDDYVPTAKVGDKFEIKFNEENEFSKAEIVDYGGEIGIKYSNGDITRFNSKFYNKKTVQIKNLQRVNYKNNDAGKEGDSKTDSLTNATNKNNTVNVKKITDGENNKFPISTSNNEIVHRYSNIDVKNNPDKIYVFGDNTDRKGTGGQAQIRHNKNAFGIATKIHPTNNEDAFMSDESLEENKSVIDEDIKKIKEDGRPIVFPKDGFGTGLAKLKEKAPKTYQYLKETLLSEFGFDNDTGEFILNKEVTEHEQKDEVKIDLEYKHWELEDIRDNVEKNMSNIEGISINAERSFVEYFYGVLTREAFATGVVNMSRIKELFLHKLDLYIGRFEGNIARDEKFLEKEKRKRAIKFLEDRIEVNKKRIEIHKKAKENIDTLIKFTKDKINFNTAISAIDDKLDGDEELEIDNIVDKGFSDTLSIKANKNGSYLLKRFYDNILFRGPDGRLRSDYETGIAMRLDYKTVDEIIKTILVHEGNQEPTLERMLEDLEKHIETHPFLMDVIEKLENPDTDKQLINTFVVENARHKMNMNYVLYFKDYRGVNNLRVIDTNGSALEKVIRKNWEYKSLSLADSRFSPNGKHFPLYYFNSKNEMMMRHEYVKGVLESFLKDIGLEYSGTMLHMQKEINKALKYTKEEDFKKAFMKFLSDVGLDISSKTYDEYYKNGITYTDKNGNYHRVKFKYLFKFNEGQTLFGGILDKMLRIAIQEKDINVTRNPEAPLLAGFGGALNILAKREAKNTFLTSVVSFKDGGKGVYGMPLGKFATNTVNKLVNDDEYLKDVQDKEKNSFGYNALWYKFLNHKKFREHFSISHNGITNLRIGGQPLEGSYKLTEATKIDYDITELGYFQMSNSWKYETEGNEAYGMNLRGARYLFPTMSDKSQALNIFSLAYVITENELTEDGKLGKNVMNLLYDQLVKPELERIIEVLKNDKETNIKNFDKVSKYFISIPQINSLTFGKNNILFSDLVQRKEFHEKFSDPAFMLEFREKVNKIINDIVFQEVETKKKEWGKHFGTKNNIKHLNTPYLRKLGKTKDQLNLLTIDFVVNKMVALANMNMLFVGDPAQYNNKLNTAPDPDNVINTLYNNMGKRLALLLAPRTKLADSNNSKYRQVFLQDLETSSENISYLTKLLDGTEISKEESAIIEKYNKHSSGETVLKGEELTKVKNSFKSLKAKYRKSYPYFSIEATDAQEYTTLSEHMYVLYKSGHISDKLFYEVMEKYRKQKEFIKNNKNKPLPKELLITSSNLRLILQPMKPVHTGSHYDENNKLMRMMYIKSSSFPLIPQITNGEHLDNLRIMLEDAESKSLTEKIELSRDRIVDMPSIPVRAVYSTGAKVGNITNPLRITNNDNSFNMELTVQDFFNSSLILPRENFGVQSTLPPKFTKGTFKVSLGTQTLKLLFGGGIMHENGFSFKMNNTLKRNLPHFETKDSYKGDELQRMFNETWVKYIETKRKNLQKEFGLDENYEPKNVLKTALKFQKILEDEVKRRELGIQDSKNLTIKADLKILMEKSPISTYNLKLDEISKVKKAFKDYKNDGIFNEEIFLKVGVTQEMLQNNKIKYEVSNADFTIPLWLSPNSNKYEALFNSIISKKIIDAKLPGNSFVVGSEALFKKDPLYGGIDRNRIVYTKHFDKEFGALKSAKVVDGKLQKTQVFMPSRLTDNEGKFIFLIYDDGTINEKYVQKDEEGNLSLKEGMISDELLSNTSFRIPTSSHVSMSQIEIAGFLPPEVGDLMIVSKSLIIQKGLDFDIDKETVYIPHHYVDKNGKITLHGSKEFLNDVRVARNKTRKLESQVNLLKKEGLVSEIKNNELNAAKKEYTTLTKEMEEKEYENAILEFHKSVLENPSNAVQKKINSVLSMEDAEFQAFHISDLINENVDNTNFSPYTNSYQRKKSIAGSTGKDGIAIYSSALTMHSLLEQQRNTGEAVSHAFSETNLFNQPIYDFGIEKAHYGGRTTAEIFAELQNIATDNEKAQIMGRLNINKTTIGVQVFMHLTGFDKAPIKTLEGEKLDMSIPLMLINQPIIRDYVDVLDEINSKIKDGSYAAQKKAVSKLVAKYFGKKSFNVYNFEKKHGEKLEATVAKMSPQKLYDNLNKTSDDIQLNKFEQVALLLKFIKLNMTASKLVQVQSYLNINSRKLGKSFFDVIEYEEFLQKLDPENDFSFNIDMHNIHKLVGDFKDVHYFIENNISDSERVKLGYIKINNLYIKPTTPIGAMLVNAIQAGLQIAGNQFPYAKNVTIKRNIDSATAALGVIQNTSSFRKTETRQLALNHFKRYIFSSDKLGLFANARKERQRLVIEKEGHQTLNNYINTTLSNPDFSFLKENPIFKKLEFIKAKDSADIIRFPKTKMDAYDEEVLYRSFFELIKNKRELPKFQGEDYNTVKLVEDIIKYSYAIGGISNFLEIVGYIPVEIIELLPLGKRIKSFINNLPENTTAFTDQFTQHNFKNAEQIKEDDVYDFVIDHTSEYKIKDSVYGKIIVWENLTGFTLNSKKYDSSLDEETKDYPKFLLKQVSLENSKVMYRLFKLQSGTDSTYELIPIKGNKNISEYLFDKNDKESDIHDNLQDEETNMYTIFSENYNGEFDRLLHDNNNAKTVIKELIRYGVKLSNPRLQEQKVENETPIDDSLSYFIKNDLLDDTLTISFDKNVPYDGAYDSDTHEISISEELLYGSVESLKKVVVKELIHSLVDRQINEYIDDKGNIKKELPKDLKNLKKSFDIYREYVISEYGKEALEELDNNLDINDKDFITLYPAKNLKEFVEMIFTEPLFREKLKRFKGVKVNKDFKGIVEILIFNEDFEKFPLSVLTNVMSIIKYRKKVKIEDLAVIKSSKETTKKVGKLLNELSDIVDTPSDKERDIDIKVKNLYKAMEAKNKNINCE